MSRSRDIRAIKVEQIRALHEELDPAPQSYQLAVRLVADALGYTPEALNGWDSGQTTLAKGETDSAVERLRDLFRAQPTAEVADISVALLGGSYDRPRTHDFIRGLVEHFYGRWRAGEHASSVRDQIRDLAESFSHAVQSEDYDLVMQLCSDESLVLDEDGDPDIEDLRSYWFESLAKLKDPRVRAFCRTLLAADRGKWQDLRALEALMILAQTPDAADKDMLTAYAESDPDSEVRRDARRLLALHS